MSEALRLADLLERDPSEWGGLSLGWKAAAELRRLATVAQELEALKRAISDAEPVAWQVKGRSGFVRATWTVPPNQDQIEVAECDGDTITQLYTLKGIK